MPVRLLVKSKAETGAKPPQEMVLGQDLITVGRDDGCQVVLKDPFISRNHLRISRDGALYFLEDLGSSHGTRVNGSGLPKGEKRLLRNGDVIAIGPYDLTFDRVADMGDEEEGKDKTSFVAKKVVRDALRGLAAGEGPYLRVMNGPLEGKRFELADAQELLIGRDVDVDVQLDDDDLVSRRHAKVRRDWAGTHVEDLGSRNGIKVNKRKVQQVTLKDRDELDIGNTRFLYLDPSEVRETPIVPKSRNVVVEEEPDEGTDVKPPPPVAEEPNVVVKQEEPEPEEPPEKEEEPPVEEPEPEEPPVEEPPPTPEAPKKPPMKAGLSGKLASKLPPVQAPPGGWSSVAPIALAVGVALFALTLLGVVFFAI